MREKINSVIFKMKAMKSIYKRLTKRTLLSIFIVHFYMLGFATNYYVSNSGNDSNTGLSPLQAWQTNIKVNATTFTAGDSILYHAGDIFTNYLYVRNSGTALNRIVYSSYGGTTKPEIRGYGEISGWTDSENWSEYSSGIFRMSLTIQSKRLWVNGAEKKESQTLALDSEHPWRWEDSYLYIKSPSNPSTYFSSIVRAQNYYGTVDITDRDNITFSGLKLTGGSITMNFENCKNITIENCEIGYRTNEYGISLYATNNDSTDNVIIRDNILSTGDSLYYTYFRGYAGTEDGIWVNRGSVNTKVYNNYLDGWSHCGISLVNLSETYPFHDNEVYANYITAPLVDYARGIAADFTSNGYNNSFHHNTVVNTSVQCQFNGNGLKVYDNIIDDVKGCPYPEKQRVGNGITISGYATPATNMEIYNNTVINCAGSGIFFEWYISTTIEKSYNNIHDNNIFNNGIDTYYSGKEYQLFVLSGSATINHNTFENNHLYSPNHTDIVAYNGFSLTTSQFNSTTPVYGDIISGNDAILKYGTYVTNSTDLKIEYNGTNSNKVIYIENPMIDQKGNKYLNSVTIPKYSSIILLKDPTRYSTEYKSICEGANYNSWTVSGEYERTLIAKSGSDSIVTTFLTVNPKYAITEDIIINEGESYNGWTESGKYTRNLTSVLGCDSIVTTNLTVESLIIKQGSIPPTHFIPVWEGENGLNHMNIMVVSADLEDLPLSVNDEIAVFSGSICVGSMKLSETIDAADNSTFLTIPASQDDGSGNGFTINDTIVFKIWDNKNQQEMIAKAVVYRNNISTWITSGKYVSGATSVVEIVSYTEYSQTIALKKGYNMISTFVTAQNPLASDVTQSLADAGYLIKLQDQAGNSLEDWGTFGGWVNNIGSIQDTEGYKIKVTDNCSLQVTGRPIALPLDIPLKSGWNIISFPRTDLVDAMNIIQPLIDQNKLIKVQDESGNSIEDWGIFGGWKNGIGYFIPGKAYKVKITADAILTIQENYLKSVLILANAEETEYFSTEIEGNGSEHMNINIVGLRDAGISAGDELAAFDGKVCVGTIKITENHIADGSAALVASFSSDELVIDGFTEGHGIKIAAWNKLTGEESTVKTDVVSGQMSYAKSSSVLLKVNALTTDVKNFLDVVSIVVFPNPSQGMVTVRFSTIPDAGSSIDIVDISGRKVASRNITGMSEVFNLDQQPAGVYLVKSRLGTNETIHKLVIN